MQRTIGGLPAYPVSAHAERWEEPRVPVSGTNSLSIAAAVLGVVPVLGGVLGIIFGFIALSQIKARGGQRGRGNALTGIIGGFAWLTSMAVALTVAVISTPGT